MELVAGADHRVLRRISLDTRQRLELFIRGIPRHPACAPKRDHPSRHQTFQRPGDLHDGIPVPKVIDFGIAKATESELTDKTHVHVLFGQLLGTPAYMSPEQAELSGLDMDTRSDIYSPGVLLYELLTGRTPFDPTALVRSGLDEMRRTFAKEPPPPNKLLTLSAMS